MGGFAARLTRFAFRLVNGEREIVNSGVLSFDAELQQRLDAIRADGLYRQLRRVDSPQGPRIEMGGRTLLNFSSNDYLGFANHPALKEAAIRAVEKFGAGAGASRLISGSVAPFHQLEETIAAFKGSEAAVSFSTGYAAALGTITALVGKDDVVILDKLVHASMVDAAKLSGAKLRVFGHNDLNDLEDILKWANKSQSFERGARHALILTESVFSMDGDHAPLSEIVALKEKYNAWLMVDEAHATGLYGANRRGLVEELGLRDMIEVQMGTLGKALGASGGYICGSRALIDFLINRARSFIFSTAPVPAAAAAATAAVALLRDVETEKLVQNIWKNLEIFREMNRDLHFERSAILPIKVWDEERAVALANDLREAGFFVPAIRYPTVARKSARLRVTLTASHTPEEVSALAHALLPTTSKLSRLRDA